MGNIKVKILGDSYQRNGIGGEPFVSYRILLDDDEVVIATMVFDVENENLDYQSCRVVNPFDLEKHYRGDRIGDAIINLLNKGG